MKHPCTVVVPCIPGLGFDLRSTVRPAIAGRIYASIYQDSIQNARFARSVHGAPVVPNGLHGVHYFSKKSSDTPSPVHQSTVRPARVAR